MVLRRPLLFQGKIRIEGVTKIPNQIHDVGFPYVIEKQTACFAPRTVSIYKLAEAFLMVGRTGVNLGFPELSADRNTVFSFNRKIDMSVRVLLLSYLESGHCEGSNDY